MKNILLTGASGFVGKQIIKALSQFSVNIIPVVRSGKEINFKRIRNIKKIISSPDIFKENESWWTNQCKDIDTVIHIAWYTEPGSYLVSSKNTECLNGSLNLARGAIKAGIKRFVGIGTCFEYDLEYGDLSINTPLKPDSPYAVAKVKLYQNLLKLLPVQSIEFCWGRLFYLYGEGEKKQRLVPYLHEQLSKGQPAKLSSGEQIRDYLDVSEAGKIIAKLAMGDQQGVFNICSGIPITVRQLAEKIADKRKVLGISQIDLGKKIGVSQTILSRIEQAKTRVDIQVIEKLCEVLSLEVSEALTPELVKKPESKEGYRNMTVSPDDGNDFGLIGRVALVIRKT